jgi:uncharacterized protein YcbK (DUF882 family)
VAASSRGRTGRLSPHFTAAELACPHCGVCIVRDELLHLLERVRSIHGTPLRVVSGYRCPVHNAAVGGATNSMHMYGAAADLPAGYVTAQEAAGAKAKGIGTSGAWAVHVDVRDGREARWAYA